MKSSTIAVLCCIMISPVVSADDWHIEDVDSSYDGISSTSIALDAEDHAHISYQYRDHTNGASLRYAYWNGSSWDITVIDNGSSFAGMGSSTYIALRSNGAPRIAYTDTDNGYLKYASWNGSSWIITIVDNDGYVTNDCSLCLDSDDKPTISYSSYFTTLFCCLKYARRVGSTWYISLIDNTGYSGLWASMALASNDKPHVAYYDYQYQNLKYAYLGSEHWYYSTVDTVGNVGNYTSIAIDSNDKPHISYHDVANADLKYAHYNGSSWIISTVDAPGHIGDWHSSIALDESDMPHISYYDYTNNRLKYARYNGSSWIISVVDDDLNPGYNSSLALDSEYQPHISYSQAFHTNNSLRYAYYEPVGIEEEEIGSVGYTLSNIIPNPCAGSANISFSLPVSCDVNLDVFDITGRKVAELAEGVFSSGMHETEISGLSNGIYFCTLSTGEFVEARTLVVIK